MGSHDHSSHAGSLTSIFDDVAPAPLKGVQSLPFVATDEESAGGRRYWVVPATGGHFGGREAGSAMALSYLKYLRENGREDDWGPLPAIVRDMCGFHCDGSPESVARHGQLEGFFSELEKWLAPLVQAAGEELDQISTAHLVVAADLELQGQDEKVFSSLPSTDDDDE